MRQNIKITVGIPAWNEEDNIGRLIGDLMKQDVGLEVVVCSDASDDNTDEIVSKTSQVRLIRHKNRTGKAGAINTIFKNSETEAVVIVDADVRISDSQFIGKLTKPIFDKRADLTSADQSYTKPRGLFDSLLALNMDLKSEIFRNFQNGNNFFTCHGQARAFSKALYKTMDIPFSVGEDMYTYVYCIVNNFKYVFVKDAVAMYKLPENISDHINQSSRFLSSIKLIEELFGREKTRDLVQIPWKDVCYFTTRYWFKHPIKITALYILFVYIRLITWIKNNETNHWNKVSSSKLNS
jgi:glycosyltransferase involved in cell wall biosynthesis